MSLHKHRAKDKGMDVHKYKSGDKSKILCQECIGTSGTTFRYRKFTFTPNKGKVSIHRMLVGVCNKCNRIVFIPGQSRIRISELLNKTPTNRV